MADARGPRALLLAVLLSVTAWPSFAQAPTTSAVARAELEEFSEAAMVQVDGRPLFRVHGVHTYPAPTRAEAISRNILALARDRGFDPATLDTTEVEGWVWIGPPEHRVMRVHDVDGVLEGVDKRTLSHLFTLSAREAITRYREARSREALLGSAWRAGTAVVLAVLALFVMRWVFGWLHRWEASRESKVKGVSISSFELVRAHHIWAVVRTTLRIVLGLAGAVLMVVFVQFVLGQFPWTQGAAFQLQGWFLAPLQYFGRGLLAIIPDLIFLFILFLATRYVLGVIKLFFDSVGRGAVELRGFYPEWAGPTYNLVRLAVIAFSVVLAYPHVPGASSDAFKGVSIFMGAILSLGSTGVISNIIAGYTMVYRRAFREGDMIRIDDTIGFVTKIRLQVTHLRTRMNEDIVIPNVKILGSEVTNFSTLAENEGLILHTTVGIGYETPWRQVEAMLIEAANRTPGMLREPKPFVRQRSLGDFAITYELNVYTRTPHQMALLYSLLHGNILDVFNEHSVQIMTPAYEGDPETPKVVAKQDWHLPPATPAGAPGAAPDVPPPPGSPAPGASQA